MHEPIDRGALRALAAKASDGPWLIERRDYEAGEITYVIYGAHDVTWSGDGACPNARADARYIAAVSPAVLLALLDALDAAERKAADAEYTASISISVSGRALAVIQCAREHVDAQPRGIGGTLGRLATALDLFACVEPKRAEASK